MNPGIDIAGEYAVQVLECEYMRERMSPQQSAYRLRQIREAIELARGWRRP